MEKLEKLKKERAELDKRIEALEYAECLFEEGEKIWSIDYFGNVQSGNWGDYAWIDEGFIQGHIFLTEKEAKLEVERRNLLNRFKMFREKCNGEWKPDFNLADEHFYFIIAEDNRFLNCESSKWDNTFNLFGYFKNISDCNKAIELFGDEIKELFLDLEDD